MHCDCNSFFASVELLEHPELKNLPVAVTGDPENRHGIILAKNERAKKFGIQTAETIYSAKLKCPNLVCIRSHMQKYYAISKQINAIYLDYTDLVEPFSVDESFLDVTGSIALFKMTPKVLADTIRQRVKDETGITISVGVSFCKVFAKLGSDYKKPDATTVFDRENIDVVHSLPVSDMLFVGKKTAERLMYMSIRTIGQLADADRERLIHSLGESGNTLWKYANGLDDEPVRSFYEHREPKSIGNGMTFRRDIVGKAEIHAGISALCDELAYKLRESGKKCSIIQVTIKDPRFHTIQRQKKLDRPTWLLCDIIDTANKIVSEHWKMNAPIRMLTVTVSGLIPAEDVTEQLGLFCNTDDNLRSEKREKIESALAGIRSKMGHDAISIGIYDRKDIGVSNLKHDKSDDK